MNKSKFIKDGIKEFLSKSKIATLADIKAILGTKADITVRRKLKELGCVPSYSHRGKFYTHPDILHFNKNGLWSFNYVHFSKHGNLINTLEHYINNSPLGCYEKELENLFQVVVRVPLLKLFKNERILREKILGLFLYYSSNLNVGKKQIQSRNKQLRKNDFDYEAINQDMFYDELKAAIILFLSLLNEKQRRIYAGLESLKIGYGGDSKIANWFGLDVQTVAKGRKELFDSEIFEGPIRKPGGGRISLEKKLRKSLKKSGK